MQLRFQLQGISSVTKGKQGRVKETEGVLNGAIYSHCHGFFSVQKILRKKPKFFVQQEEAQGSDFVAKAVDLAARELITSASLGQVTQVQLDRAKVSTKSAVLMNLESRYWQLFLMLSCAWQDIRRELGMDIIEEHTVMEYSQMRSANKGQTTFYTCTDCGHQSQEN
ncbi:Mitochondrial-processing peptidase subunit alpha [Glycine max]|nr:Mitochondrial-processing peptidase subunit alpha [Glycine max]